MQIDGADSERILELAHRGCYAQVIELVLVRDGLHCAVCPSFPALTQELKLPAGAALISEEALNGADLAPLAEWLAQQASWSEYHFVVLVSQLSMQNSQARNTKHKKQNNNNQQKQPINAETLRSAAASALRARRRQY